MNKDLKNIILISDQKGSCVDSILASNSYNIKLIVVPYKYNVDYLKEKYGSTIENYMYYVADTNAEFQDEFSSDHNLTYEEIEQFRDVQLKCFRYNTRYLYDDNANNSIYYTVLKFLLGFFSENKIDMVFSRIMEHGAISDSLIFEIAKKKDIPVYIIAMNTGFNSDGLFSILKYNSKRLVDISHVTKNEVNYSDMLTTLNSNYSSNKLLGFPFSKMIKKFLGKKNKTLKECIQWVYEYRIKYYLRSIKAYLTKDLYKIREETSLYEILRGFIYRCRLKIYYKMHSIKNIEDENYIFYPLHMEPEAANLARATLGCQLFIIEQVSQLLPEGYFLYVKEHPDQFASTQLDKYYYKALQNFRNIDFYKRISMLRNVKMLDICTPSSRLIDNSKAVLSIAGSALIEAVAKNKPIIVFGDGTSCVELLSDAFVINQIGSITKSLEAIKDGFTPSYNDFSAMMNKYVFSMANKEFYGVNSTLVEIFNLLYKL